MTISLTKRFAILAVGCVIHFGPQLTAAEVSGKSQRTWVTNGESMFVIHTPKQAHRFNTWQKLNPVWWFGNADEPSAPDWYLPGGRCRNLRWHLRNPFHNFDCYVIGLSDKRFTRVGRFPEETFNPHNDWNWGVCLFHGVRFPYLSYSQRHLRAYFGWRPGGAFGMEFKLSGPKKATPSPPHSTPASSARSPAGQIF